MEKQYKFGIAAVSILTILGLLQCIVGFGKGPLWSTITCIVMFVLIFYYAIWGYKKPHGNMLKYLMLLYALSLLASIYSAVIFNAPVTAIGLAIAMIFIGYIAGRLNRVEQNRVFMIIVLLILIYEYVLAALAYKAGFFGTLAVISPLIMWIDLYLAYLLRYKEHKEAGLMDAPKE